MYIIPPQAKHSSPSVDFFSKKNILVAREKPQVSLLSLYLSLSLNLPKSNLALRTAAGAIALVASQFTGQGTATAEPAPGVTLADPISALGACSTAEDFLKALENDDGKLLKALLKRLEPFSSGLAGSALHIANERKQLFAMMGSRLLNSDGFVAVFGTYAPCDRFNPVRQLFKNKH